VVHFLINRANLALALAGAKDKVIGKAAYLASVQQDNIAGLLFAGGFYSLTGYL